MNAETIWSRPFWLSPATEFFWITTQKNGQIDAKGLNKYGLAVDDLIRQGVVYKSDTIEGLAKFIGCDPKNIVETVIVETVNKWREYCKTQDERSSAATPSIPTSNRGRPVLCRLAQAVCPSHHGWP